MKLRKQRWSRVYESSEEELLGLLEERGITATRIYIDQLEQTEPQTPNVDTSIWCVEGSATIVLAGDQRIAMQAGDHLGIPAFMVYETQAGISGYTAYVSTS